MHQLAVKTAEHPKPKPKRRHHRGLHGHQRGHGGYEPPYRLRNMRPRFPARKGFGAGQS